MRTLFLYWFDRLAVVVAALGTYVVRTDRLTAMAALADLRHFSFVVGSAFVTTRARGSFFRYCHFYLLVIYVFYTSGSGFCL
jgi:hypothetical protein